MFDEYEIVRLKKPIAGESVRVGTEGTVLIVYEVQSSPRAYEIEFSDQESESLAVLTVLEEFLEKV